MRWRGQTVAAGFILVMGVLVHACGGRAVGDLNDRSGGLGEAGGASGNGNTSSTAGSSTSSQGGSSPPSMGSGSAQGGASPGTSGGYPMPAAGAGPSGVGGTTPGPDPMCLGISRDSPCPIEGHYCDALRCGLADQGVRTCACTGGVWACTPCDFTGSVIEQPPAGMVQTCTSQADEVSCTIEWELCAGAPNGEVCACYAEAGQLIWDCDYPPASWP